MGIFIAPMIARREPKHQDKLALILFVALVVVVVGSLLGEAASIKGYFGRNGPWFWLGQQGWEYLDLGRLWQILLIVGMVIWVVIVVRGLLAQPCAASIRATCRTCSSTVPCRSRSSTPSAWSSARTRRSPWWISGGSGSCTCGSRTSWNCSRPSWSPISSCCSASCRSPWRPRVIYLDIILYSVGGVIGTMHHLYFSGAPAVHMALGAFFSAMEVIPLVLLTYEAWRFMQLGTPAEERVHAGRRGSDEFPHKWAVMFLIAVGFWNFLGAGVFGFLINLPIVSYYEIGTQFTANHGHGAMMGVYGMLAIGFFMFVARYFIPPDRASERAMKISFWSLNIGLAGMVFVNLVPVGLLQLNDSLQQRLLARPQPGVLPAAAGPRSNGSACPATCCSSSAASCPWSTSPCEPSSCATANPLPKPAAIQETSLPPRDLLQAFGLSLTRLPSICSRPSMNHWIACG